MEQNENTLSVLKITPGQYPQQVEIDNNLKALQEAVGGTIAAVYPFADPVAIICNDDGKLMGLPLNRALRDENGQMYDGLLEYYVFRQKERQKGLQRPRWRLKCFYSDLRILSNGSQAILWHPAMSFAFLEDKQDKSIPTLDIRVLLLIGSG